jgi:hypothetical protein
MTRILPLAIRGGGAMATAAAASLAVASLTGPASASTWDAVLSQSDWQMLVAVAEDAELIDWLRDDSIKWNAMEAGGEILARLEDPARHGPMRSRLEAAFEEALSQGIEADRQFHEAVLGLMQAALRVSIVDPQIPRIEPSQRLLQASIRPAAEYWGWNSEGIWIPGSVSSRRSLAMLTAYAPQVGPMLVEAMREQRRGSRAESNLAFLVAHAGGVAPVAEVAAILIAGLEDNHRSYDALMGIVGLWRIGPAAAGPVRLALQSPKDLQQQRCLELLIAAWDWPAVTSLRSEAAARLYEPATRITWRVIDPLDDWWIGGHSGEFEVWPREASPLAGEAGVAMADAAEP